jgi:hypothetical protein
VEGPAGGVVRAVWERGRRMGRRMAERKDILAVGGLRVERLEWKLINWGDDGVSVGGMW